jgi:hypothetical protein
MDPVATLSKSPSRCISLLRYLILRSAVLSRPLRQRHASSAYCKHQREPIENLSKRLVTVSSPSQIVSQGMSLQGNGRAKPLTGLAARRGMERAGRTGSTLSARTLRCACLHHRLTRLAGCTASTTPTFSSGNKALPRPVVFVVLPRALPSVSRTHAIVRTVGTARSSAHSNNLSQSRTRRLRVRECDRFFASSSAFGVGPVLASTKFCRWRGVTNSTLMLSKSIPKPCYKQYTGIFKIDTEMTCYRQYMGVLKIDTVIESVLYIRVHSSQDRHCCIYIYIYKYISGRDQVEVSKARSNRRLRITFVFGIAEGDRVSTLRQRNSIKPEWASRKLSDLPTWRWLPQPAHPLDVLIHNSISKCRLSHSRTSRLR